MLKRMSALAFVLAALATFSSTRALAKASADDAVIDHFFSAIRNGNFNEATSHFSARMKGISPAGLKGSWNQVYAAAGPLRSWKIFERQELPSGYHEIRVQLFFPRATTANSIFLVNPQNGEINSVLFKLPVTAPPYADQKKFRSDDVVVGPHHLPATVTIPNGKGPFPAVLLVQGSGPNDRDETVGANHPFADLAQGLSSRGIVVLRYDKRNYATWDYDPKKATVDAEVIEDAVAAIRLLGTMPSVAQDRIFIVGHSLGARLAPEIANKAGNVAGIVMLAPLGRNLAKLIVEQTRSLGQASGGRLTEIEKQADELSAHKMQPTDTFFSLPASYFYDLDARDEVAIARSLNLPILILHGSQDFPIVDEDIRDWQIGLKGRARVQVKTLPSLNHLFIAGAGNPKPADYFAPGHVDASVIGTIASFIANAGRIKNAAPHEAATQ
jgi:hypothetical protein